jgi:hypothetical protein
MYKNHPLFRGHHLTDLHEEEGSNAHHLLILLADKNPQTADMGLDQKAMDQAIRAGQIEDIRDEFPVDWYQHISKIASNFHASKNYLSYFTSDIIMEVAKNLLSGGAPFDKDKKFIQYKLVQAVERSGLLDSIPSPRLISRDPKQFQMFVDHVMSIAQNFWKKADYSVFFPDTLRLDVTAYYLSI